MTYGQKNAALAAIFMGIILAIALFCFLIAKALHTDKQTAHAMAIDKKPMFEIRQRLIQAKPGSLFIDEYRNICFITGSTNNARCFIHYYRWMGDYGDVMEERLLSEKITRVVFKEDAEYKDLLVNFASRTKAP